MDDGARQISAGFTILEYVVVKDSCIFDEFYMPVNDFYRYLVGQTPAVCRCGFP
jgi:hypothetical protein